MKQTSIIVNLLDFAEGNNHPYGNEQGKHTFRTLVHYLDARPWVRILGISLAGIVATDASFPRESVLSVARHFRCEKGIFLVEMRDRDMIDNWRYAAIAKDQPLVIWYPRNEFEIIGPDAGKATLELVSYVLQAGTVSASQVAEDLDITVQNASTRLKKLFMQGYILRTEETAESGGKEFLYEAIKDKSP
jgi:hypothetical protein